MAPEPVVDGARAREGARNRRYVVDIPLGLVRVSIAVSIAIVRAGVRVAGASLVIRVPGGSQGQRLEVDVVVVVGRVAVVDATAAAGSALISNARNVSRAAFCVDMGGDG